MVKKKQHVTYPQFTGLLAATIVLGLTSVIFGALLFIPRTPHESSPSAEQPFVSLGGMRYSIKDGRATIRRDAAVQELQSYLETRSQKEQCGELGAAHLAVKAYSPDETQVLLGYGCGNSEAPMYLKKSDKGWQAISPTNHFYGPFNLPECHYIDEYQLVAAVAPVCVERIDSTGAMTYHVR